MKLLSVDKTTFYEMAANDHRFPKPVVVGKNAKGHEVKRYKKAMVLLYLECL